YQVRMTPAYETTFRGAHVFGAALANGGLTCLSALNMLEALDPPPSGDPMFWHLLAEVLKLAWRDRLRYLGDPEHAGVPWGRFLDKAYAAERIHALKARPESVDTAPGEAARWSPGTIHISTADADGNLVAVTISHGGSFGSCVTVPGTGITLGHGMCRFDPRPGRPNSPGPGKRPLNNVCPSIIRMPGRDIAAGLRGGRRIVSVNTRILLSLLEGQSLLEAVAAPRVHLEGYEPLNISPNLPEAVRQKLEALGHTLKVGNEIGGSANVTERSADGALRAGCNVRCAGVR
ncbi:MAG: gamma-glutamyltransferase, partial [Acidobacteria bacterium]|nr:gamma-glutamyltransferase [Acidobacteriota bacterium]